MNLIELRQLYQIVLNEGELAQKAEDELFANLKGLGLTKYIGRGIFVWDGKIEVRPSLKNNGEPWGWGPSSLSTEEVARDIVISLEDAGMKVHAQKKTGASITIGFGR